MYINLKPRQTLLSTERYGGYSYSFESSHGTEAIEVRSRPPRLKVALDQSRYERDGIG